MSGINVLLMGTSGGVRITLANTSVNPIAVFPATASATYELQLDGDIVIYENGSPTDIGDWIIPRSAAGSDYEVFATLNSGTLDSGTTGSWLGLGTTRSWGVTRSSLGTKSAQIGLEIRRVGTVNVLGSCTVDLSAEVTV